MKTLSILIALLITDYRVHGQVINEVEVHNMIAHLPETQHYIKKSEKKATQHPDSKVTITTIVKQKPSATFEYYWVQVGISDKIRFTPDMNFYVSPSGAIVYLDTRNDSLYTIEAWRNKRKK